MSLLVAPDQLAAWLTEVLAPSRFFLGAGLALSWQQQPAREYSWEVFQGRLLPPSQTRQRRTFTSWNVYQGAGPTRSAEPLLALYLDSDRREIHVVRGLECYVQEGYDAGGGVFRSREQTRWVRELVGTVRLDDFPSLEALAAELEILRFHAVVGTSRLPLSSLEAPLPDFTCGHLFTAPDLTFGAGPVQTRVELLNRTPWPLPPRVRALWLQTYLLATPATEASAAADDLVARWSAVGGTKTSLSELFRELFREVALSPWTDLTERVRAFVRRFETVGHWDAGDVLDFHSSALRQLVHHLTAYDLITFHHRGANYPDALLLDALLEDFLAGIERRPDLLEGDDRLARLRRRALRQAYLTRRRYEGHLVPEVPTSTGENARVMPGQPRVPEEQLLHPTRRTRRLFAGQPLPTDSRPHVAAALRRSVADLADDRELREGGIGLFLDRPFGVGKSLAEPDGTLLLASVAFSRTLAVARLHDLAHFLPGDLDASRLQGFLARLHTLGFVDGVPLERIGAAIRPGAIALADARLAAADFVFLHTTAASLAELRSWFDFAPLAARTDVTFLECPALLARAPKGPGVVLYDAHWRPRLQLETAGVGFVRRGGREWPAGGLMVTGIQDAEGMKVGLGQVTLPGLAPRRSRMSTPVP
jgi:hypothetical protein